MNEQADHPNIEKLPLEIDGIPVRETIREIFRDRKNGRPDDITKRGCLELALKSNEVGGAELGHVVWNIWRMAFPVLENEPYTINSNESKFFLKRPVVNVSNFAGIDFDSQEYLDFRNLNFSSFNFGQYANFSDARKNSTIFQSAIFGAGANFKNSKWGDEANFIECVWGDRCDFQCARWGHYADFTKSRWGNWANFNCARWGDGANFELANWNKKAQFQGAQWGSNTGFLSASWGAYANFVGSQWCESVEFVLTEWKGPVNFSGANWSDFEQLYLNEDLKVMAKNWADEKGTSPIAFDEIDFRGARFFGEVKFLNRKFKNKTRFDPYYHDYKKNSSRYIGYLYDFQATLFFPVIFQKPPMFHGSEIHQDTSFDGAVFPKATGNKTSERAYRTLKHAFSEQHAVREEQRFFRLEIGEEAYSAKGWRKFWFLAYENLSDFGFSVWLPILKLLLMPCLFFMLIYQLLLVVECPSLLHEPLIQHPERLAQWLTFSFSSAFPTPEFDVAKELRTKLYGSGLTNFVVLVLSGVQKVFSLFAIFLSGLALRNLFKLK